MSTVFGKDAKKPSSTRTSRFKTLERSSSQVSLNSTRVSTQGSSNPKPTIKRSQSVTAKKDTQPKPNEEASNAMDPESEDKFYDSVLELNDIGSKCSVLDDLDLIQSKLLFLQDKAFERQQSLVELTKKLVLVKEGVDMKQQCDQLIPDYVNATEKLESLATGSNLGELHRVLDHMNSRLPLFNFVPITSVDVQDYKAAVTQQTADLEHLKRLRVEYEECEPVIEETVRQLETLGEKVERLQFLKAEISRMDNLGRIRSIQTSANLQRRG